MEHNNALRRITVVIQMSINERQCNGRRSVTVQTDYADNRRRGQGEA